jgi:SAM-dependent methyltransferase
VQSDETNHGKKRRGGMLDMTFRRKLSGLLDECLSDHLSLETDIMSSPAVGLTRVRQAESLAALLDAQFEGMDRLIGDDAMLFREAAALLRGHALHRDVFLQSAVVAQRQSGVGGGPFGFRFRRMVFERPDLGYSPYAQMLNEALLDLPLCRAMRTIADSFARAIAALPAGAGVLGLGCGPATEVLSLPEAVRARLSIELQDPDPEAIAHVARHAGRQQPSMTVVEHIAQAPGAEKFQLIYAAQALAAMPRGHGASDPAALMVRDLFRRLAPGGRLLLACPIMPGGANPHRHAHRMLIEGDEAQAATHRSPAELIGLTALLPDGGFRAELTAEDMMSAIGGATVQAVLAVQAP